MRIALDYDGTYTADPEFWGRFCDLAKRAGHSVVCITMRYPTEPIEVPIPVIYTSRQAKVTFMEERGEKVDVWIDDSPNWLLNDAGDRGL
jgi:hypothetical protein